jgi:hypothetical protein
VTAREPKKRTIVGRLLCAVGMHVWVPYFELVPQDKECSQVQLGYRCEREGCDVKRAEAMRPPRSK